MRKILITFGVIFTLLVLNYIFQPLVFEAEPIEPTCDVDVENLVKAHNALRAYPLTVDDKLTAYAWNRHPEFVEDVIDIDIDTMPYEEIKLLAHSGFQEDVYDWFPGLLLGENLMMGSCDEEVIMQTWIDSPGHYKNIMDRRFDGIGIYSEDGYTVVIFGDLF